ncbi:PKD domain-containing protein [Kribbella deserti]|uniref:Minor tail protein n=1 Tax=Kribbella deserti TaxID=1926257 RepID=A0ABV6QNF3_9ACTN
MPTLDLALAAGTDDLSWSTAAGISIFSTTATVLRAGDASPTDLDRCVLVRFDNVTIPAGATITTAYLTVKPAGINAPAPDLLFDGCLQTDPVAPTTRTAANALPRTTASVLGPFPAWTIGTPVNSPELKTILQEIVDQGAWASGNAVMLFIRDNQPGQVSGQINFTAYDGTPADAPKLHVEYTTAFAGVADAGPDQADVEPFTTVTLNGTGSTGSPSVYEWTQTAGPAVALSSSSAASPTFPAPADLDGAAVTFSLRVGDGVTMSAPDTVQVTVLPHDKFVRVGTGETAHWEPINVLTRQAGAWV